MKKHSPTKFKTTRLKIGAILVLALILFMTPSCKKWLEEKPQSAFSSSTFFSTVEEATMAVLGVYEVMSSQQTYGFNISLVYDIDSDIAQMSGGGFSNDPRTAAHYGITPLHAYIAQSWALLYKGIDRANLVIERIQQMTLYNNGTQLQKSQLNRLLGEAKFLRGFYYFELVRLYGDVPMKLKSTEASDNMELARLDRYEVYTQIIKDMTEAAEMIPWNKELNERISKGAVKGILARVGLYAGGYSLRQDGVVKRPDNYKEYYIIAQKQTKEIIDSAKHSLNASYEQVFRNHCSLKLEPQESMFEVAFFNTIGGAGNSGVIGTWNAPIADNGNPYGRANSFYKALPTFYKSYKVGDLRKDVAMDTMKINVAGATIPHPQKPNDHLWAPGKWRRNWQSTGPKDLNNTDINWCLLRYADILLMYAEAENELNEGPSTAAYESVNRVRRRGFGKPIATANVTIDLPTGLSKDNFLKALQQERAWELCFEGMRKADLIRWNILGTSLRATRIALSAIRTNFPYEANINFVDNKHELYPIPAAEFDLNHNPGFVQNPKY